MSYLVLARKWRPQTFAEVVGQEHITETLKKAVEKNRLAHAYIFAGPRGCGKTTTARILAKVINCEHPKGAEPDNECPSCRAIIEGRHLDVIEIDGASNRGIDEIRDLREKISYAPAQGRFKIYIIDEVHMLTPQAFNALLKTLEEPPAHVYLIFATTEPHKVPSTILSRCQRFNFKRLETKEIVSQLEKICAEEKIKHAGEALVLIARRAEGSMRDGESLLDQCVAASEGAVDLALVRRVLGLVEAPLVNQLLAAIARRDRKSALEVVDRAVSSGLDLEEYFLGYVEGLRNLLVLNVAGSEPVDYVDLTKGEIDELRNIGSPFKTENLLFLFRSAVRTYRELKASGQPRYQLEAAVAEAASWESAVELSELIRRIDGSGGEGGGKPAVESPAAQPAKPAAQPEADARSGAPGSSGAAGAGRPRAETPDERAGKGQPRKGAAVVDRQVATFHAPVTDEIHPESFESDAQSAAGAGPAYAGVDRGGLSAGEAAEEEEALKPLGGREAWERFLSRIREAKLTLGIWLMSARVKRLAGERLLLSFTPQNRFAREMIHEDKNRRFVEFHLERFFGRRLVLETDEHASVEGKPEPEPSKPKRASDAELEKLAGGEPFIKRLIEEFDGELYEEGT
jgi:DNA polymerase-3 subunit gamma/tau